MGKGWECASAAAVGHTDVWGLTEGGWKSQKRIVGEESGEW